MKEREREREIERERVRERVREREKQIDGERDFSIMKQFQTLRSIIVRIWKIS